MARGRMISKTLGSSRRFARLSAHKKLGEFGQALYPLIVSWADDFGRLPGDAFTVKHRIFPTSTRAECAFETALDLMAEVGLIRRYTAERQIIEVDQFAVHQAGLHKRTRSSFPGPPEGSPEPVAPPRAASDRVASFVSGYPALYHEIMGQPYLPSRVQTERDLEAGRLLCEAYSEPDLDKLVRLYLSVSEDHPKAKLLRGSQRTLPKLVTMVGGLAEALDVRGGETDV